MFLESLKYSFTYTFPCSHKIPNSTRGLYILYSQMAYYFMVQNWSEASDNVYSSRPRIKMFASLVIRTL